MRPRVSGYALILFIILYPQHRLLCQSKKDVRIIQLSNQHLTLTDAHGNRLTTSEWEELSFIDRDLLKAFSNCGWRVINTRGEAINEKAYLSIRYFKEHRAAVQNENGWGFIDETGAEVIPAQYDFVLNYQNNYAAVLLQDEWIMLDISGKKISDINVIQRHAYQTYILNPGKYVLIPQSNRNNILPNTTSTVPEPDLPGSCPPNLSFEMGNFSNWNCYTGSTSCSGSNNSVNVSASSPTNNRHTLITRTNPSIMDLYGNFPINPPDGSTYCLRLGNTNIGSQAERVRYIINVPTNATNYSINYQYAVVFEDPNHQPCQQPRFSAKLFDPSTNTYLPCGTFEYVSDGSIPGFFSSPIDPDIKYKPWSPAFINLSPYAGKTLYLEFTTADCTLGAHWGYAYLDVNNDCNLTAEVAYQCTPPNTTVLTGPPGFQSYKWWNFDFSNLLGTSQTLTLNPGLPVGTNLWVEVLPYTGLGCRDTLPVQIVITYPTAAFTAPTAQCFKNNLFNFTSNSTINTGTITEHYWDFGDGTFAVGANVSHSYSTAGSFNVKLRVTSSLGCKDSITHSVTVYSSPTASFNAPVAQCRSGNNFNFTSTSTIISGSIASHNWDFGDGGSASGISVNHSYATHGSYLVRLIAISDNGCRDTVTHQVVVYPQPTALFSQPPSQCARNNLFAFTSNSTIPSGNIINHLWDFGDASTANGVTVSHNYTASGTYTVKLLVITDNGCRDSISRTVTVFADPLANIIANAPLSFCAGDSIHLTSNSQAGSGTISSLQWLIGGVPINGAVNNSLTVFQSGNYQLEVRNSNGCITRSAIVPVVSHPLPVGSISLPSSNFICDGTPTTLQVTSGGSSFQWYRNNILIPGATSPSYLAQQSGLYTVQLTSPQGCKNFASGSVNLTLLLKPIVDFDFPVYCAGTPIRFENLSDTSGSGTVTWKWDLGDGTQSSLMNPIHTYGIGTNYTVTLLVTPVFCPNLAVYKSRVMPVEQPRPGIRYAPVNALKNVNTQLTAREFGNNYLWLPSTGLSNPLLAKPVFKSDTPEEYIVRIRTTAGCTTYDTQLVRVFKQIDIQVPKAFTPNSDGHNDKLDVFLIGIKELKYFRVFNRWGQLLYETRDALQRWDGTYKGMKQPLETYVWTAEGVGDDGSAVVRRGQTVLIR